MDLLKAREKARKKAEEEKKAALQEKPAKKKSSREKPAKKKAAAKAKKKPAAKAGKKPSKEKELKERSPEKTGEAEVKGKKAKEQPKTGQGPAPDKEDVFHDEAFGEDLPMIPAEAEELSVDGSCELGAEVLGAGEAGPGEGPGPGAGREQARDQGEEKPSEAGTAQAGPAPQQKPGAAPYEEERPSRRGEDAFGLEAEPWTLDRVISEDEDFFTLVTEDLYMREFDRYGEQDLSEMLELLSFSLAQETYAVRLTSIRQIIKLMPVTMVPRAPDYVLGVISLRGTVIPVFDLRRRLNLEAKEPDRKARIVVVGNQKYTAGLIVDQVQGVVRIKESMIEPPPSTLAGVEAEYIEGIGRQDGNMIIMLELDKILVPVNLSG